MAQPPLLFASFKHGTLNGESPESAAKLRSAALTYSLKVATKPSESPVLPSAPPPKSTSE